MNNNVVKFNMDKFLRQKMKEERQEQIYEIIRLRRKVRNINKALKALRDTGYYDESISVENLLNQLTSKAVGLKTTESGNISLRPIRMGKFNITQITAIEKSIQKFIENKTSTPEGMEALYAERRNELRKMFKDKEFVDSLSKKDIKSIYSVFQSNEYDRENKRFDSKSFFTIYLQAIDEKKDKEWFIKEMKRYQDTGNDEDLREAINDIYEKYISKYANR